jgi:hypothetical protein
VSKPKAERTSATSPGHGVSTPFCSMVPVYPACQFSLLMMSVPSLHGTRRSDPANTQDQAL